MAERILDVKNLKVDFHTYAGEVKAIRDVSFHLDKGETLAIVGESGSGKSVTTKAIIGLLANNAKVVGGEINFNGQDILKKSEKEMIKMPLSLIILFHLVNIVLKSLLLLLI